MSLVNCPSCGKERVSDSATTCPNCGFNVKEYYLKLESTKVRLKDAERKTVDIAGIAIITTMVLLVILIAWSVISIASKSKPDKYVESDIQLCKTVKYAMEEAALEAKNANEKDYIPYKQGDRGKVKDINRGGTVYMTSIKEILGVDELREVDKQILSVLGKKQGYMEYVWVSNSSVVVFINNTDRYGGKKEGYPLTKTDCKCIYEGSIELLEE